MRGGKGCVGQEWDLRRVQVLPTDIPLNVRTGGLAEGRFDPELWARSTRVSQSPAENTTRGQPGQDDPGSGMSTDPTDQ